MILQAVSVKRSYRQKSYVRGVAVSAILELLHKMTLIYRMANQSLDINAFPSRGKQPITKKEEPMSVNITWPTKLSTYEKAERNFLRDYLSNDGIGCFVLIPEYDKKIIFEMIQESGRHVSPILLR